MFKFIEDAKHAACACLVSALRDVIEDRIGNGFVDVVDS
jgi:hypothetical protein